MKAKKHKIILLVLLIIFISITMVKLSGKSSPDYPLSESDLASPLPKKKNNENKEKSSNSASSMASQTTGGQNNGKIIRILGIGNSFTIDSLNNYLYELAIADNQPIVVAHLTIGGISLEDHYRNAELNKPLYQYVKKGQDGVPVYAENKSIEDAILDEKWDYISFQQQHGLAGQFHSYEKYLPALTVYAKSKSTNPEAVYTILQTWAFASDYPPSADFNYYGNNQLTMFNAIVDATEKSSALVSPKMLVIPVGTAIQNGRTSSIGDKFCRDGFHLDIYIGRLTAACAVYEAISGNNVMNNSYIPDSIPDCDVKTAKQAAHFAVARPNEVTEMPPSNSQ